jgi:hypothetical protein
MEDEKIKRLLKENEIVLWSGKPAPFRILGDDYRKQFLRSCLNYVLVAAALVALYFIFCNTGDRRTNLLSFIATVGIPLVVLISHILNIRSLRKKCVYYITSQSIRGFISDSMKFEFALKDIDNAVSVSQNTGTRSILIGSSAARLTRNMTRERALKCLHMDR